MNKYLLPSLCLMALTSPAQADGSALTPVSYTHLTLPTKA